MDAIIGFRLVAMFPAMLVVGCAPLQQAPLVYSSKVTIGVDVSGTTTEQPGVSINLGYKQIDAAYVPVAVAKDCESMEGASFGACQHTTYQLREITGRNSVGSSELPKNALEQARRRLDEFKQLKRAKDDAESALVAASIQSKEAEEQVQRFEQDNAPLRTARSKSESDRSAEEARLVAEFDKRVGTVKVAVAKVKSAEASRAKADEALSRANVPELAEALILVGGTNEKTDAYSVFGSFDANTKAGVEAGGSTATKGSAGLVIGKVFSTGVASQNLTEGMRQYYSGIGSAQADRAKAGCLSAGETYIAEMKKLLNVGAEEGKKKLVAVIEGITEHCRKDVLDNEKSTPQKSSASEK